MKVKEVADLTGISVRTLHHYDEIGLLVPDGTTEAGYRDYSERNLELLQQILFFRELGFSLKKIKEIVTSKSFDRLEALERHREMLNEKRSQLEQLLRTVEQTIRHAKGEVTMTNEEKFKGFDFGSNPYEQEARERWGDKAVDESNAKMEKLKQDGKMQAFQDEMNELYRKLASVRHDDPSSEASQEAIGQWFTLLNQMGSYSLEAFKGLGQMYVDDARFTRNIDQFGEGLALFMRDAMAYYSDSRLG
ncbi:MerR family transcriptional regulator [Paenibacillus sp. MY03]|jgi:DNA-binding transcriptional MerR regulator|uniref:MerR family transcriptional regulator n=1 Tax=Paenibacillus sp. MY03 TaxID=302980 RepID=UPI000B3D420E|nr:MerR family transcriptional regulator [Paenibacillus sp. MY03]OUS76529.1 MerR family transcriptional regulator [Paenibacillus sp. MY03]